MKETKGIMKVFTDDFVQAVKAKLDTLEDGFYLTREQICTAIGVDLFYINAVSIVMSDPLFSGFESVRSRGVRKRKIST